MPDSNLSTSIAAVKTKITTDAPTATVDEILSLARAAKSVGLSEDAAVESAINSRVLTLSSGATTANMVKLANVIKQVRDATSSSGLTDISQLTDTTNLLSSGGGSSVTVSDNAPSSPSDGDMWFNSLDLKLYIRYNDGTTSQWIIAAPAGPAGADSTVAGPAGPAGGDGRAGVYADMAALIAKTGMVAGDTALVTALNKVFMYTGSAWFLIATMTNDSPTAITGVDAAYNLATDGTATIITAVSTDPEGFPLTWSYAVTSGSLGSTATVSQADNVFTITPSTTESDAGTFSITFSVTDGATGAVNAVSAFTLSFVVANSRYTTLSVRATNTGSNQIFDDASTSNHTITANGDTTASTFSPHRHGGYSASFDGTGDYISTANHADFNFGSGNFTIESYVYYAPSPTTNQVIVAQWHTGGGNNRRAFQLRRNYGSTGSFRFYWSTDGSDTPYIESTGIDLNTMHNQWIHVAVVRNGNTITMYVNGTDVVNTTLTGSLYDNTTDDIFIGSRSVDPPNIDHQTEGYISDLRVIKGTAIYTSNFTPPTEPLTAVTNTTFLLGRLPYFKDQSTSNHAITPNGNVSLEPISVYDNAPYSEAFHGASVYFDGTGDSLSIPNSTEHDLPGDFTIECWAYFNDVSSDMGIMDKWYTGYEAWDLRYNAGSVNDFSFFGSDNGANGTYTAFTFGTPVINQWYHLAVSRTGSTISTYVNGNRTNTTTNSNTLTASYPTAIGADGLNGYLTDARIVKGTALYTGTTYTVPTAPLTAITNTKFLLNPETSISDLSQRNALICRGDVETSTTQVKFAGTKSIYFAGTDDYIHVPNSGTKSALSLNSTKFTIEGWFYKETNGNWQSIISKYRWANNLGWSFDHLDGGNFRFRYSTDGSNSTDLTSSYSSRLFTGAWGHVALVANNNLKLYIDGVGEVLSASALPAFFDTSYDALIGALRNDNTDNNDGAKIMEYNGWMQDLRIHNNHAQYTADFTPPTAELEG